MEEPRPGERQKSRREVDSPWSALPRRGSLSQRRRTTQRWPLQSGYLSLHSVSSATETSPVQHSLGTERLALEAFDACRAVGQLEQVAVGKSVGELLLVRYQQDATQLAAQVPWKIKLFPHPYRCRGTIRGTNPAAWHRYGPHMARPSKPWFRAIKNTWYCTIEGRKVSLGVRGKENARAAKDAWHRLMATPREEQVEQESG